MIPVSLSELADVTGGALLAGTESTARIDGPVVIDSRLVGPGALFACLPGERVDGHDFAAAAVAAGAAGVLATRPVSAPGVVVTDVADALAALARSTLQRSAATVVGVTGSSGKTSTKDLLAAAFEPAGPTVAPAGSFNNELGLPLTVCRITPATRWLICEYSARGIGHIAALCRVAPPVHAAVLNVGRAHMGEFGGTAAIAHAKGELVEALPGGGTAVLNADDPLVAAMRDRTAARVLRFGTAPGCDVRIGDLRLSPDGRPAFTLETPQGPLDLALRLVGAHHAANAAAVVGLAVGAGLDLTTVAAALAAADPRSPHRMAVHRRADGTVVIDDAYNANPESVAAGLDALARIEGGRRWAVLGAMRELGPDSVALHEAAGAAAARRGVDRVIAVGADAQPIAAGAATTAGWTGRADAVPDIGDAVALLDDELRPGDIVLVKASNAERLWRVAEHVLAAVPASAEAPR